MDLLNVKIRLFIKDNEKMVKNMVKVNKFGQMEAYMKGLSTKEKYTDMED